MVTLLWKEKSAQEADVKWTEPKRKTTTRMNYCQQKNCCRTEAVEGGTQRDSVREWNGSRKLCLLGETERDREIERTRNWEKTDICSSPAARSLALLPITEDSWRAGIHRRWATTGSKVSRRSSEKRGVGGEARGGGLNSGKPHRKGWFSGEIEL